MGTKIKSSLRVLREEDAEKADRREIKSNVWVSYTTPNAQHADELIREHLECEIIDTESETFCCYSCNVSVRWVG